MNKKKGNTENFSNATQCCTDSLPHPSCKNISNSRMTKRKEDWRLLNNNQTPARADETTKIHHKSLYSVNPRFDPPNHQSELYELYCL